MPKNSTAPVLPYRPSAFYWRGAIRSAKSRKMLEEMALTLVAELEIHKAAIRALGYMPPKCAMHPREILDKGYELAGEESSGVVVDFNGDTPAGG